MSIYFIPIISAILGWLANILALKMLFSPKKPVRFLGLTFHGLLPAKQQTFAQRAGALVAEELLNFDSISAQLKDPAKLKSLAPLIETHLDHFLEVKLQEKLPVLSMFVGADTLGKIKEGMMEEIELLLPQIISKYTDSLASKSEVESMVVSKLSTFPPERLEYLLKTGLTKTFSLIGLYGALTGFIIGLVQVALLSL